MTELPPVALVVFNRPDLAARQVEVLGRLELTRLLVIADGPRPGRSEESACAATRRIIDEHPWRCPVERNYAADNMGCARRIVSGIDWVFGRVDRAVILEDDCLAHPAFFRYAAELLAAYEREETVMHICGTRPFAVDAGDRSYWFSHHVSCWGWATWARAWAHLDMEMELPATVRRALLERYLFQNRPAVEFWERVLEMTRRRELDAWDYPWQLSIWRRGGLAVFPHRNLVTNVGFRGDATHTKDGGSRWARLPLEEMAFPLRHPARVQSDERFDRMFVNEVFSRPAAEGRPEAPRSRLLGAAKKLFSWIR